MLPVTLHLIIDAIPACCTQEQHAGASEQPHCAAQASVRSKIDEHDIQFVLRKDARKAHRAAELLVAQRKCKEYKAGLKSDNLTGEDIRDQLMLTQDQDGGGGGEDAAK